MVVKPVRRLRLFVISFYSGLLMFIAFGIHGAASEYGKLQYNDFQELRKEAVIREDIEEIRKLDGMIRDAKWTLTDPLTVIESYFIGGLAGSVIGTTTFFMFRRINNWAEQRSTEIGSSRLFLFCSSVGGLFFLIYELTALIAHSHIATNFYDVSIAAVQSFTIVMVVYFQIMIRNRLVQYSSLDLQQERVMKSIELENKTWSQIFQSLTYALLFLVFGFYVVLLTDVYDIGTLLTTTSYYKFVSYQTALIGLILFGFLFGVLGQIIWYLGRLNDVLRG